ncbi:MAG TPA: hypothetical protein VLI67_09890 [Vicinamibacteria bacterium]|nr:hypothetical protein [Vicinamibacteria bacterium]
MRSEARPLPRLRAALLLAALAVLPAPAAPPAEVVERILAVVDDRPVLLSEVRVVEEVRGLSRAQALEALIDERLMFEQAARLPQGVVSDAEVKSGVEDLLAGRPALAGRVTEADLRRLVRRQAAILKFVEFRFRPQVRVPDGLPPEEREAEIRRALDERIEAWVEELRAGAEVRYNR